MAKPTFRKESPCPDSGFLNDKLTLLDWNSFSECITVQFYWIELAEKTNIKFPHFSGKTSKPDKDLKWKFASLFRWDLSLFLRKLHRGIFS